MVFASCACELSKEPDERRIQQTSIETHMHGPELLYSGVRAIPDAFAGMRNPREAIVPLLAVPGVALWLFLIWAWQPLDRLGTDFFPIYYAAGALARGHDPYGAVVGEHLQRVWSVPFASAGNAYPLPVLLVAWPLTLLPLPLAVALWASVGSAGAFASVCIRSEWLKLLPILILFMPLHRAIVVKQATLIWFALVVLLLLAMRRRQAILVGLAIAMLPAKPQAGLLFALAGCIWAWREQRRALIWAAGFAAVIWGLSFALYPSWVPDWLASVRRYNDIVAPPSLLPGGLLLPLLAWGLPWWARLAMLQVVLFPITDTYSALPLLLAWIGIGGPLGLAGAAVSWLGVLLGLPNSLGTFWLVIMAPLMFAAAIKTLEQRRIISGTL
jgi:hypothetical protein